MIDSQDFTCSSDTDADNFFFIMNFQVLTDLVELVGHCKECSSRNIFIKCATEERQGFSQKFYLVCEDCTWSHGLYSSPKFMFPGNDPRGKNPFEVNVRSIIADRI